LKKQSPNSKAWKKFKHNALAFASLGLIFIFCFVAFFAYLLAPDHTPNANEQFTILAAKSPGFEQKMLLIKKDSILNTSIFQKVFSGYDRDIFLCTHCFS
jgi:peptide/nickel transport system permease protein